MHPSVLPLCGSYSGVVLVLLLGEETRSLKHCCTAGEDIRWWIMKFLAFAVSRRFSDA